MRFGDKLKQIFNSFELSLTDVSELTSIDEIELYDIVNNNITPSLETLDILSYLVGQNLYGLYTKSLSDGDIFEFIESVDEKNTKLDFDNEYELEVMERKIQQMKEEEENPVKINYARKEYHRLYAKNLMYNHGDFQGAGEYIKYYLLMLYNINVMYDDLERIHPTDARIILLLVESLLELDRHKEGLLILRRLIQCESIGDLMQIKCINLIAELYQGLDMPRESYQFAELGIELSIKHNMNALMPDLLFWKAMAEVALEMSSAKSTIDSLIRYTRILRADANLEKYVQAFKDEYGIDIMRPGRYKSYKSL